MDFMNLSLFYNHLNVVNLSQIYFLHLIWFPLLQAFFKKVYHPLLVPVHEYSHCMEFTLVYVLWFKFQILEKVKLTYDLPIVTDVHESSQVSYCFNACFSYCFNGDVTVCLTWRLILNQVWCPSWLVPDFLF